MKTVVIISRIIVGLLFIFSGFVKGLDPLGTMFKIEDYIFAYNMDWAVAAALPLSIILCTIEFTLGISVLFGVWLKYTKWLLLAMMLFFTGTTLFDAIYNLVPDCGCFGDAIKLTPWQTFFKNVLLMIPTLIILLFYTAKKSRNVRRKPIFPKVALVTMFVAFGGFSYWSYANLPIIDFMDWNVGKVVYPEQIPIEHFFVYKNNDTGEQKQWRDTDVPYEDSLFNVQWSYDTLLIIDKNELKYTGELHLYNENGDEITELFLRNKSPQYMITSYDVSKLNDREIDKMVAAEKELIAKGFDVIIIANGMQEDVNKLQSRFSSQLFNVDDTVLKTMVRANPGVIVFQNGAVIDKYNLK